MTDPTPFEAGLAMRLVAHASVADRPIDAGRIAATAAVASGRAGGTSVWSRLGLGGIRVAQPALLGLALVALLVAMLAVGLVAGGRQLFPAVVQASDAPSPSVSTASIAVLPGEPWLVYGSPSGERLGGGLILVREDGTDRHEILAAPDVRRDHADWSRDGARIAFDTWYPDPTEPTLDRIDIWLADADGANPRQLTSCELPCLQRSYPAWSPDGTQLAFIRYDLVEAGIWGPSAIETTDLATGEIRVVAETADGSAAYYNPRWSPDGRRIVFTIETYADASGSSISTSMIAIVQADGSDGSTPRILSPADLNARYPDWHPSDDRIVFEADTRDSSTGTSDLYVIRADGSGLTNLTAFGRSGQSATMGAWTPDGARILFSHQSGSAVKSAAFIDADGSDLTLVSFDLAASPRLRPVP